MKRSTDFHERFVDMTTAFHFFQTLRNVILLGQICVGILPKFLTFKLCRSTSSRQSKMEQFFPDGYRKRNHLMNGSYLPMQLFLLNSTYFLKRKFKFTILYLELYFVRICSLLLGLLCCSHAVVRFQRNLLLVHKRECLERHASMRFLLPKLRWEKSILVHPFNLSKLLSACLVKEPSLQTKSPGGSLRHRTRRYYFFINNYYNFFLGLC